MMKNENLSKKELEELCIKEKIILERKDPFTKSSFYLPNMEKIKIMIREFDFLVEGASRGKAINEISKIERFLYENEDKPDLQNNILATNYSQVSIYLEEKKDLISDKRSENWNFIFTKYFNLEDIYNYFHKKEGASGFFRKFRIFDEMVELNYNLKLMEYLQSQLQLLIPLEEDKEIPFRIDRTDLALLVLLKTGFLDILKEKMKEHYYIDGAKLITTLLGKQTAKWKHINSVLWDIDHNPEESIASDSSLNDKLKEILYHFKIDLR